MTGRRGRVELYLKQFCVLFRVKTTITPHLRSNSYVIPGFLFTWADQCRNCSFAGWYSVGILYMIGVIYDLKVALVLCDVDEYLKGTSHA